MLKVLFPQLICAGKVLLMKERELLCGHIIDRPIRPLFPHGFYHEVQVFLSHDLLNS
jgi:hypothetical protein